MVKVMIKSIVTLFSSPRYFYRIPFLEKIGVQKLRLNREIKRREKILSQNGLALDPDLLKDGIVIKPDYLGQDFKELQKNILEFLENGKVTVEENKDGYNVDWKHGIIPKGLYPLVDKVFRENVELNKMVELYTGRKIFFEPEVIVQELSLGEGKEDYLDTNTVLHSDRHYSSIKVFMPINNHTVENGAFVYVPGSHILDEKRASAEVDLSYREAVGPERINFKHFNKDKNRFEIDPKELKRFTPKSMTAKKGTLIIADVCGYHARGQMQPGTKRITVRIIFHYLYSPWWAQWIFNLLGLSPGRYLN